MFAAVGWTHPTWVMARVASPQGHRGQWGHGPKWRPGFPWSSQQRLGREPGPGARDGDDEEEEEEDRKSLQRKTRREGGSVFLYLCSCLCGDRFEF